MFDLHLAADFNEKSVFNYISVSRFKYIIIKKFLRWMKTLLSEIPDISVNLYYNPSKIDVDYI